jgi:hypothetical protein
MSKSNRCQRHQTGLDKAIRDLLEYTRRLAPPRRFLSKLPILERVVSWVMLAAAVLAVAAFLYHVVGSVPQCDETLEQCEAYVGPYQVQ